MIIDYWSLIIDHWSALIDVDGGLFCALIMHVEDTQGLFGGSSACIVSVFKKSSNWVSLEGVFLPWSYWIFLKKNCILNWAVQLKHWDRNGMDFYNDFNREYLLLPSSISSPGVHLGVPFSRVCQALLWASALRANASHLCTSLLRSHSTLSRIQTFETRIKCFPDFKTQN